MMKIRPNHIIQITDEDHPWHPCLLIVEKVYGWGVRAVQLVPTAEPVPSAERCTGRAYIRIDNGRFALVGDAAIGLVEDEAKLNGGS